MASPKFLIIACALLLVQAQALPQPPVEGRLMDLIKFLVPKAEKAVDWILDTSGEAFDEASKDPIAYQAKTAEKLDEGLGKALDWINKKLDTIKEKASANTAKVIDCVTGAEVQSKAIVVGFYNRTTGCMAPEVQDLLQKLADLQPDLRDIKTKAFAAANKVQDCSGTNAEEANCLAGVVEDVLDSLRGTSSDVVQKEIDIILTIVNKLEDHVPKCVSPNILQARKEVIETIDSITACITA